MKWSILLIVIYNIIFIPLQFAYRIEFTGIFAFLETVTILLYLLDIFFRCRNWRLLRKAGGNLISSSNLTEQTLMDDKDHFERRMKMIKIEICCSAVALVPFSLVFQSIGYHEPLVLVDTLCLLRLVKLLPFIKLFE